MRALLAILVIVGGGVALAIFGFHWLASRLVLAMLASAAALYFARDAWLILVRRRMDKVYDLVGRPFAFPERAARWRVAALLLGACGFALCAILLGFTSYIGLAKLVLALFALPAACILYVAGLRFGTLKRR